MMLSYDRLKIRKKELYIEYAIIFFLVICIGISLPFVRIEASVIILVVSTLFLYTFIDNVFYLRKCVYLLTRFTDFNSTHTLIFSDAKIQESVDTYIETYGAFIESHENIDNRIILKIETGLSEEEMLIVNRFMGLLRLYLLSRFDGLVVSNV